MHNRIFTSESVTEGHPDKICDQISDGVLDAILSGDPMARVACECATTTGMVLVMGEITTSTYVDIPSVVRNTIRNIGYTEPSYGFDSKSVAVLTSIDEQSPDIAQGVDHAYDEEDNVGAGDQGMMFGFACDQTPEYMPAPISMAGELARQLAAVRKNEKIQFLRPDGKTQVTVEYGPDGDILSVPAVVVSTQHDPSVDIEKLREAVMELVIKPIIPAKLMSKDTKIFINPTGRFVIGGPVGDSGLTGRKIIVDTYGGYANHGGGAFSGKDPTKVDRGAAYMSRYVAKNVVAAGLAKMCQVEVAYAIGVARPVSLFVDTRGTGVFDDAKISRIIGEVFDMRPAKIIAKLGLRSPIFQQTAAYGHFGRPDLDLPWEKLDSVDVLKSYL